MARFEDDQAYQICFVTFLDILGFRNLIRERDGEFVANLLKNFRTVSTPEKSYGVLLVPSSETSLNEDLFDGGKVHVEIISDAFVRVRTIGKLFASHPFRWEIATLVNLQIMCVRKGIFIRGALTKGYMHLGEGNLGPVFGPALVEAYKMEESEVVYPRIAVYEEVVDKYFSEPDPLMENIKERNPDGVDTMEVYLTRDDSGLYFINYLFAAYFELGVLDQWFELMLQHKKNISEEIDRNIEPKITRKYVWLKNYHNKTIDRFVTCIIPTLDVAVRDEALSRIKTLVIL